MNWDKEERIKMEQVNDGSFGMASLTLTPVSAPIQKPSAQDIALRLGDWVAVNEVGNYNQELVSSSCPSSSDGASTSRTSDAAASKDWDLEVTSSIPRRKRKMSVGSKLSVLDTPICRKFAGNLALGSNQVYESMRCNEDFVELQFEFISSSKLRKLAQVSTEWQKIAYKVIRRRIGNKPFTLLWAVEPCASKQIDLQTHFHPSFMEGSSLNVEAKFDPFGWRQQWSQISSLPLNPGDSESFGCFGQQPWAKSTLDNNNVLSSSMLPNEGNQTKGCLSRAREKELETVKAILVFGNPPMESELLSIDEREMPRIKILVQVIAHGIFYTTPDCQKVGNSFAGLEGKQYEIVRKEGGKFLSSLCIPKSPFLSIDILPFTNAEDSVKYLRRQYTNPYHTTKALVIFKMYEETEVDEWIQKVILKQNHEKSIPMITGQYSFLGTNKLDVGSVPPGAIALRIMGDKATSVFVTTIEIRSDGILDLNFKFQQIMEFINLDIINDDRRGKCNIEKKSLFALMFSSMRAEVCVTNEDAATACHPVDVIVGKFHEIFPFIPIQGLVSDKEVFCQEVKMYGVASVSESFPKCDQVLPPPSGTKDAIENACNRLIILIVKYPQKNRVKLLGRINHSKVSSS